jgi:hypothetical protein
MDEEHPSITAEGAAVMRALHQTLDDEPKSLDDPISPRLVDSNGEFYQSRLKLLELLPALRSCGSKQRSCCAVGLPKTVWRKRSQMACVNTCY